MREWKKKVILIGLIGGLGVGALSSCTEKDPPSYKTKSTMEICLDTNRTELAKTHTATFDFSWTLGALGTPNVSSDAGQLCVYERDGKLDWEVILKRGEGQALERVYWYGNGGDPFSYHTGNDAYTTIADWSISETSLLQLFEKSLLSFVDGLQEQVDGGETLHEALLTSEHLVKEQDSKTGTCSFTTESENQTFANQLLTFLGNETATISEAQTSLEYAFEKRTGMTGFSLQSSISTSEAFDYIDPFDGESASVSQVEYSLSLRDLSTDVKTNDYDVFYPLVKRTFTPLFEKDCACFAVEKFFVSLDQKRENYLVSVTLTDTVIECDWSFAFSTPYVVGKPQTLEFFITDYSRLESSGGLDEQYGLEDDYPEQEDRAVIVSIDWEAGTIDFSALTLKSERKETMFADLYPLLHTDFTAQSRRNSVDYTVDEFTIEWDEEAKEYVIAFLSSDSVLDCAWTYELRASHVDGKMTSLACTIVDYKRVDGGTEYTFEQDSALFETGRNIEIFLDWENGTVDVRGLPLKSDQENLEELHPILFQDFMVKGERNCICFSVDEFTIEWDEEAKEYVIHYISSDSKVSNEWSFVLRADGIGGQMTSLTCTIEEYKRVDDKSYNPKEYTFEQDEKYFKTGRTVVITIDWENGVIDLSALPLLSNWLGVHPVE